MASQRLGELWDHIGRIVENIVGMMMNHAQRKCLLSNSIGDTL